ncbi:hypothetical protein [Sphingomonas sp. CFBP 13706]|uniref:hypothetical protein n=1 Tax=Sphingomonas sp. CFBP 13706 TaxID=2775314 RepID=UPI00177AA8E7|nr:hypothetical protein [Sphingomonas sp. CFBP 13706]MBD8736848.1 hypothetical protein [Sphingomonas sp. CFBP 13706]
MMWILKLNTLEPGDVILEPGIDRVAKATGGIYGHASMALGKLVRIEAGKDDGVVIAPFDLAAYNRNGERVVGLPLESADALVLRRRERLDLGTLDGRALWEAGRAYDLHRALDLPDLVPRARDQLVKLLAWQGAEPNPDGRTCSEVAARILDLPAKNVSPNALVGVEQLKVVEGAIVPVDDTWTPERVNTAAGSLASLVAGVEVGLARDIMGLADGLAAEIKAETISEAAAGDRLTSHADGKLRDAIVALLGIRELENSILHEETQRV